MAGSLGVGFGETMYYKGVAEGEDTEGMMMILFGPGEMQLFTEKKATRDLTVYWSCRWDRRLFLRRRRPACRPRQWRRFIAVLCYRFLFLF